MKDRGEAMVFGGGRKIHHYVYVDNLGLMSTDEATVKNTLKEVQEVFESHQLILRPGEVHQMESRL